MSTFKLERLVRCDVSPNRNVAAAHAVCVELVVLLFILSDHILPHKYNETINLFTIKSAYEISIIYAENISIHCTQHLL